MSDKKIYAKNVNFKVGVPSLGSKLSLQNTKGTTLEVSQYGIVAMSRSTGRSVLIPYSNISGIDLVVETEKPAKIDAPPRNLVARG